MSAKEYWIKKGTNDFDYINWAMDDGDGLEMPDFNYGDDFYDKIVEREAIGGLHVIEYSEYEKLKKQLVLAVKVLDLIKGRPKDSPEMYGVHEVVKEILMQIKEIGKTK